MGEWGDWCNMRESNDRQARVEHEKSGVKQVMGEPAVSDADFLRQLAETVTGSAFEDFDVRLRDIADKVEHYDEAAADARFEDRG